MASVKVEGDIAAPLDVVWKLVSDFAGFIEAQGLPVATEGNGIGMTRTLTVGSVSIVEKLETLDEAGHSTSYSIQSGPFPFSDYTGTIKLDAGKPDGAGDTTHLTWSGSFEPQGVGEAEAASMIEGIYRNGIKGIQKYLGA